MHKKAAAAAADVSLRLGLLLSLLYLAVQLFNQQKSAKDKIKCKPKPFLHFHSKKTGKVKDGKCNLLQRRLTHPSFFPLFKKRQRKSWRKKVKVNRSAPYFNLKSVITKHQKLTLGTLAHYCQKCV